MTSRLPRRSDPAGESGFTLVELMVAISITSVLLTGLVAFAVGQLRANAFVDAQTTDVGNGQLSMVVLTRDLRAAVSPDRASNIPLFLVAEPNEVWFFAALGESQFPSLVRIFVSPDGRLIEEATPAAGGTLRDSDLTWNPAGTLIDGFGEEVAPPPADVVVDPNGQARERYVASYVANAPSMPLFTYFELGDTGLEELIPATPGGELSLEQRRRIQAVEVTMAISSVPAARTGQFVVQTQVRLPAALGR